MHVRFVQEQIQSLDRDGYLGCGQELKYNLEDQRRFDSGDAMNFYWMILARRACDSGECLRMLARQWRAA
jgi:hypothetical protein